MGLIHKTLWKLFSEGLTKEYLKETNKPLLVKDLNYAFTDNAGRRYYRFPESTEGDPKASMPFERLGMLQRFITHLNRQMDEREMKKILDRMDEYIQAGLKDPKIAAKMGALVHHIRMQEERSLHTELIYNILAVQYIREDESPDKYNNELHMEKVEAFKEDAQSGHSRFFFRLPELKRLFDSLTISDSEWKKLCERSELEAKKSKEVMNLLRP